MNIGWHILVIAAVLIPVYVFALALCAQAARGDRVYRRAFWMDEVEWKWPK